MVWQNSNFYNTKYTINLFSLGNKWVILVVCMLGCVNEMQSSCTDEESLLYIESMTGRAVQYVTSTSKSSFGVKFKDSSRYLHK